MKYGWLDERGQIKLDYHGAKDRYLGLLKKETIGIPDYRTFCFVGYKTSITRFLLDYPSYMFKSSTDKLYMRGGDEMDNPAKMIGEGVGKIALAPLLAGHDVLEIGHFVLEHVVDKISEGVRDVKKPGKISSFMDRRMNKRLIVTLMSMTSPKLNKYDSLKVLKPKVTFQNLAGYIHTYY